MAFVSHGECWRTVAARTYTWFMTSHRLRAGAVLLTAALGLTTAIPATAAEVGTGSDPGWFWNPPHCDTVYGDGSVTITSTDGAELAPTKGQVTPVTYPKVAALDAPNTLISIGKQSIQRSSDAGCSWQQIDKAPDDLSTYDVAAGAGESAYVYSVNDQPIHRVQGSEVSTVAGPVNGGGVAALSADRSQPGLIRTVGGDGQVFDSADNGRTWQKSGVLPAADLFIYNAAIDPSNRDHIVVGTMSVGAFVTFDGGRHWTASLGLTRTNGFTVVISPANPSKVWVEGYDLNGQGNSARHIWQSTDGGLKFDSVLDGTQATLINGNKMWPSPVDPDLLYFSYGTSFGGYGSDLYRFRPSTGELTWQHNRHDGIPSVAFNRADPTVLYLGLAEER